VIVTLTADEKAEAEKRTARSIAMSQGWKDRAGVRFSEDKVRFGVRAEMAAAIAIGSRLSKDLRARYDLVGGPFHVRGSRIRGRFALQVAEVPKLLPTDFVIAVLPEGEAFNVRGWLTVKEALRRAALESVGRNPPAYWISADGMWPLETMPGYNQPQPRPVVTQRPTQQPAYPSPLPYRICHACKAEIAGDDYALQPDLPVGRIWFMHRGCVA
jgi:hypothetical protein